MKAYLTEFFNDFDYQKSDAEYLLSVYGKIAENEKACEILGDAISAYTANINIDHKEEILGRSKKISNITY